MQVGTCKLCEKFGELQDSHFMSKGIFAQLRTPTAKNPHPVLMTPQVSLISSQQIKDYAFCGDCEQRFSRNGESWVLANMARMNGFKLQDALFQARPVLAQPTIALYAGASIASIDMNALVYFAMSIFWRAPVQEWKSVDGPTTRLDLGGHDEEIRRFLLGGPFPTDAVVLVSVWPNRQVLPAAHTPREGHPGGFKAFDFLIPGIDFQLLLGAGIPADLRQFCAQTSPSRYIAATTMLVDKVMDTFTNMMKTSAPSEALLERVK
jgi:hypothetical protein